MKLQKITIDNFRCFKHFEITNLLGGCNIHIKSRGNNIVCKGFLKKDADILKQFLDKFR